MHPPFPFRLRRKGNGPCTVISALRAAAARRLRSETPRCGSAKRKGAWAQNGTVCLICLKRGGPRKRLRRKIYSRSVGRGPSSSQSPYPSLPAYAESSLIPMLVLSPRKPLRWVFAGAPDLLKLSVLRPRRSASVRRGCKPDLTCFFSPLPLCRPRGGLGHFIDLARSVLVKYYNFQSM